MWDGLENQTTFNNTTVFGKRYRGFTKQNKVGLFIHIRVYKDKGPHAKN